MRIFKKAATKPIDGGRVYKWVHFLPSNHSVKTCLSSYNFNGLHPLPPPIHWFQNSISQF